MSKKSKYKYEGYGVVRDTEIDFPYHTDDIVDLLEEKDQQITDLQNQLAITEKALELACETIKEICGKPLWIGGNVPTPKTKDSEYFIIIAKEMLENE